MSESEAPVAPNEATAPELFRALRRQIDDGRLKITLEFKRLNHMDSPVASEADSNIFAYGVLALALFMVWWRGWLAAGIVALVGTIVYYSIGLTYTRRRLRRRVQERALSDLEVWQKLWRFGGVSLHAGSDTCAAPQGNWMALVRGQRREEET
jgi:hypothetical protein